MFSRITTKRSGGGGGKSSSRVIYIWCCCSISTEPSSFQFQAAKIVLRKGTREKKREKKAKVIAGNIIAFTKKKTKKLLVYI